MTDATTYPTGIDWGDSPDPSLLAASIGASPLGSLAPISPFNLAPFVTAPADVTGFDLGTWWSNLTGGVAADFASYGADISTFPQRVTGGLTDTFVTPVRSAIQGVEDTASQAADAAAAQAKSALVWAAVIGGGGLLLFAIADGRRR